ncbi:hypothetical protein [Streptomonospora nanhaiensis]|uniref:hypothetical protein n=1 Tax=Streptomonospora nanhaiensis TaxID=1323731 RepID=UPI001C391194|nr:hypothetical protein [Streptomonospora nanhaiensis]MBV2364277.1 hypothetical protein [Streptomonospora nanhaiensis]
MSVSDLAARSRGELSADAIKKIEAAANPEATVVRRVDVDELVVLAVALGVNPSALLLPPTLAGDAELTGCPSVPSSAAWAWADGAAPLTGDPDDLPGFIATARPRRGLTHGRTVR